MLNQLHHNIFLALTLPQNFLQAVFCHLHSCFLNSRLKDSMFHWDLMIYINRYIFVCCRLLFFTIAEAFAPLINGDFDFRLLCKVMFTAKF